MDRLYGRGLSLYDGGGVIARNFDGTNDNLLSADNALPGLDVSQKSWAFWTTRAGDPAGNQMVVAGILNAGAAGRWSIYQVTPAVSGYRVRLEVFWTGTDGAWRTDADLSLARHHIAVTYDRSGAAPGNDPLMYVDGVSVAFTELSTPTLTTNTGDDTLKLGENSGGGEDLAGTVQHVSIAVNTLWSAAHVNRALWWGRAGGGQLVYHPLVTAKLADEGSGAETLTATGTTVAAFATPVVRPGTALLGMGVGW